MILCCGEALIDMLPRDTRDGEAAFAPYAGGAVFNTAIALGRLGAPVQFFSGISTDLFGEQLIGVLEASKVDARPCHLSSKPTTLAFVRLSDGHASYAFYDENTAGRMLTEENLPKVEADALFFGGISLVVEPCGEAYKALMLREAPSKLTMIDPNIRPGFIQNEQRYRDRLEPMLAASDVVKISDEDLTWLTGEADPEALLGDGTSVVLMTKGAEGVTVATRRGRFEVAARKATVVDTVGAGDTFNAGFLAGIDRAGLLSKEGMADASDEVLRRAADLGAQAAAITVSRAGANPPWSDEL